MFKKINKREPSTFNFLLTALTLALTLSLCFSFPLWALEVPSEWGRVSETLPGKNGKTVVLIQEAHADYGAEKSIVEILKALIEKESVRLILVEGGWGDTGLAYLRHYGTAEGRREVADRYLKEGKISAEEYLDIASDLDFSVRGIEDELLYAANMEAFLKFHDKQPGLLEKVGEIEARLAKLKEEIYPPELLELEKKKALMEEKKTGLVEYLGFLTKNTADLNSQDLPNMKNLLSLSVSGLGDADPEKAEWEKSNLIKALAKKLTKPELARIELLKQRKSPEEELEFLQTLLKFYEKHKKKLKNVSLEHLRRHTAALEALASADPGEIFRELEALENSVREKLLVTDEQKELARVSHALALLRKLFELKLGPEEFAWMEKHPEEFEAKEFKAIQNTIPEARAFYEAASKREQALIENAVKQMKASEEDLAAMIIGGFHADEIAASLQKQGYSVATVSPRFTPADPAAQHRHYLEVLKYKWGSGPLGNQGTVPVRGLSPLTTSSQGGKISHATKQN